eukprot:scaffold2956_cov34-Phaeocystis_antarctica.AAC.1
MYRCWAWRVTSGRPLSPRLPCRSRRHWQGTPPPSNPDPDPDPDPDPNPNHPNPNPNPSRQATVFESVLRSHLAEQTQVTCHNT